MQKININTGSDHAWTFNITLSTFVIWRQLLFALPPLGSFSLFIQCTGGLGSTLGDGGSLNLAPAKALVETILDGDMQRGIGLDGVTTLAPRGEPVTWSHCFGDPRFLWPFLGFCADCSLLWLSLSFFTFAAKNPALWPFSTLLFCLSERVNFAFLPVGTGLDAWLALLLFRPWLGLCLILSLRILFGWNGSLAECWHIDVV